MTVKNQARKCEDCDKHFTPEYGYEERCNSCQDRMDDNRYDDYDWLDEDPKEPEPIQDVIDLIEEVEKE